MLQDTFSALVKRYCNEKSVTDELWEELHVHYSSKARYYHTLQHLKVILAELSIVKKDIRNWDAILFSLYYHDVIYDASQNNNEERSAQLAEKRMLQITVPKEIILLTQQQILATKSHTKALDKDTNYFTDADLSILGKPCDEYFIYSKNIRKEYSIYADAIYNEGRKKVLQHFISMYRIFKTEYFFEKYEE
jgi:predicted metal-dependent HD superfamily phosphohydrolase